MSGNILIIDDTPANVQLLAEILLSQGYEVRPTNSGKRGLEAAQAFPPDLILLDINMPHMNGYEVCQALKSDLKLREVPVLFISALDETIDKVKAFEVGGVDYITKPFHVREVIARIRTHLMLYQQKQEIETMNKWRVDYLEQMNRLKDDVLHIVSHDLKNPLGVVRGNVFLLEELMMEEGIFPRYEKYLKSIDRSAERMLDLVHDLLDLAQAEGKTETAFRSTPFTAFLEENLEDFMMVASDKQIELIFSPPSEDITLRIARDRMSQALHNLISNAIKYNHVGGRVELQGEVLPQEILIHVIDNGLGIPKEDIPHLFEKFYRVQRSEHRKESGTGLGMAIVKAVLEQHKGQVEVESKLGQGSRFTIRLPRS